MGRHGMSGAVPSGLQPVYLPPRRPHSAGVPQTTAPPGSPPKAGSPPRPKSAGAAELGGGTAAAWLEQNVSSPSAPNTDTEEDDDAAADGGSDSGGSESEPPARSPWGSRPSTAGSVVSAVDVVNSGAVTIMRRSAGGDDYQMAKLRLLGMTS